jgi:hypothetical protein
VTVAIETNTRLACVGIPWPSTLTLVGTTTVAAANGLATFPDLSLDTSGLDYRLIAYATGLAFALSAPFEVTPWPPVAGVTIAPTEATLAGGEALQFKATTVDASGNVLTDRRIGWSVANQSVLYQVMGGSVCGLSPGVTTITAISEGKSATATVSVTGYSTPADCIN